MIRGLAALLVCLFHFKENILSNGFLKFDHSGAIASYVSIAGFGWLGVEMFFVVSGFIIPWAMIQSGYKLHNFFAFFAKRCLRIEPPYLASVLIVVILGYLSAKAPGYHGEPYHLETANILSHIGYLPEHLGYSWLQPVYWSLEAEFHYYILIGLLLPFMWRNRNLLYFILAAFLVSGFFIPLYVFSYMPFFVIGISACANRTGLISTPAWFIILALSITTCFLRHQPIGMPLTGLITGLLIQYVKLDHSVFNFLGKISFSLYLLHVPVGGRVMNLASRFIHNETGLWLAWLTALALTIIASWIFFKLVEWPSQKLSRRLAYK